MTKTTSYQPRAAKGGEFGPNGEWYVGGQFIANSENTIKGGSPSFEPATPEWKVKRDNELAAMRAGEAMYLKNRAAQFSKLLALLDADVPAPGSQLYETFYQSLARQLRDYGRLSQKQSECVAKFVFGRRNRKNEDEFYALIDMLMGVVAEQ